MGNRIVIVGAGVAGLTIAERLLSEYGENDVTIIESEDSPGGLARSFEREGYIFDIGPHRFHTSDPAVDAYLLHILAEHHISIERSSSVFMENRYRNWPLTLGAVLGLPAPVLLRSLRDLFFRQSGETATFADFIVNRYGKNLYDYFFSGYTRKFTGIDARLLHVDWAAAGVNRAVIDKKVKADNLFSLLKGILLPKPVSTTFYYTSSGGIQTFCDIQADIIRNRGGEVRLATPAGGIEMDNGSVSGVVLESGEVLEADIVYWSAPISILYPDEDFHFINSVVCNIALSAVQPNNTYQWCYFGQRDIIFSRLTVPRNFRGDTVPEGRDSLVVEITAPEGDDIWDDPESCRDRVVSDLVKVRAVDPSYIRFMDWHRIPCTYPLYDLQYRDRLDGLSIPDGLQLLGRCGSFWYNNMDHSIGQALAMAAGNGFRKDFWNT